MSAGLCELVVGVGRLPIFPFCNMFFVYLFIYLYCVAASKHTNAFTGISVSSSGTVLAFFSVLIFLHRFCKTFRSHCLISNELDMPTAFEKHIKDKVLSNSTLLLPVVLIT